MTSMQSLIKHLNALNLTWKRWIDEVTVERTSREIKNNNNRTRRQRIVPAWNSLKIVTWKNKRKWTTHDNHTRIAYLFKILYLALAIHNNNNTRSTSELFMPAFRVQYVLFPSLSLLINNWWYCISVRK